MHASMFGYTGHTNGLVNGKNALISLTEMLSGKYAKKVPPTHR